jgi:hypothetical protein
MSSFNCWSEADEIEKSRHNRHGIRVTLRLLLATLIAAAMLFAPFGMQGAMAAAPTDHHRQMKTNGHCYEQVPQDQDHKSADKSCCAAMCMAVAVEPAARLEPLDFERSIERPALSERPDSYLAELPTPPPREA